MEYVVVVFAIINSGFLLLAGVLLVNLQQDLMASVETVIQEEVRRQDDRIEKRRQRSEGPAQDEPATPVDNLSKLEVGRPYNR